MGDEGLGYNGALPGAPTELAPSSSDTEARTAWALDDGPEWRAPLWTAGRITAGAVVAATVLIAGAGVLAWANLRGMEPAAVEAPSPPDPAHLNGMYRIQYDWENATSRGTLDLDRSGDGGPAGDWITLTTVCTRTCIASGQMLTQQRTRIPGARTVALELVNGSWEEISAARLRSPCLYADGSVAAQSWSSGRLTLSPRPDGTFAGAFTMTVESDDCGDQGNTVVTPVTARRAGDAV